MIEPVPLQHKAVLDALFGWRLKVVKPNGSRWLTVWHLFKYPHSDWPESPELVTSVEMIESWPNGGLARVTWDGGTVEEGFGHRKPGTGPDDGGPRSFSRSRPRDGRRRAW